MKIFWEQLLLCTIIILLRENTAEKFLSYEDALVQNADFQGNDSINYRLPNSIEPISYEIILMPNLEDNNFTFDGFVKIKAVVKQAAYEVILHVGNIKIVAESFLVNNKEVNISHKYDNITEKYFLSAYPKILEKESELLIAFTYKGILNDNMIGFYRSSYYDERGQRKWLATTQFQTTHARHAFPCFDEPSFKAKFTIRILRSENYTCLSNMPGTTEELEENKIWNIFNESIPMSTYLVAFIVSEFESREQDILAVWARPSVIEQTTYALKIGYAALTLLSEKFSQNYQLPKMDMVAVPDFAAGAMENWGLVTYRESRLLYDEKESSAPAQQSVASVILHELTHMWFGNLVTPEWWGYLWLSEAFARYFQYFGTAEIELSWNMKEQFVVEQHQSALIADGFESSLPMTRDVSSQSEIGGMGDSITYSKGASIVRMMDLTFGTNLFNSALREYLKNNKIKGVGQPEALWTAIQHQAESNRLNLPAPVETIMNTWTVQAGYPVVSVTINDEGVLSVSQERFFLRNLDETPTNVTWWVPLTWTTQSKPNFSNTIAKNWLSTEYDIINLTVDPQEWVIFNLQSSGFYRVNYDSNGWQRIFNTLSNKFDKIHVLNRAGIVDDLLNLGRAGYQDYETVLNGITYLERETNYLPFKAAFNGLDYLNKRFTGHDTHFLLKEYILSLINDRRKKLGYEDRDSDDRLTVLLRREVNNWACNLDNKECKTVYLNKFAEWRANASMRIKPNERTTAYCIAIKYGTSEDWEFLWQQYFNSNYAADQIVIINALGCSQNTTILERYLQYAITNYEKSRIRKQDSKSVFAAVYNSGLIGAEYVLDFVEKYYKVMEEYYEGQGTIATILDGASQRFSTYKLVDKFEQFINKHKLEFTSIFASLESSLRIAQYELKWYENASVPIIEWLQKWNKIEESNYRLPTNISPKKYFISVTPYLEIENFTFDGNVKIEANVVRPTKQIILHSAEIEHHTINVTVNQIKLNIRNYMIRKEYDFLVINLAEELIDGTQLTIEITYTGSLNTSELRGFYKSSYINENGEIRWLAATHLEPVGARKMFPCFDEPGFKASFTVEATVPLSYHAVSNMKWEMLKNVNNHTRQTYTFYESVKMSTYLVAVIISDFQIAKETNEIAVLARPNAINQTEYALSLISPIVTFFEDTFKVKYQLPKLYMVALPDFPSGAGENWGLITYRESYLLYDENHSTITSKQNTRNVIAHEISHQWFGNLVTPLWWKYLWLNEGFARYFEYHVPARVFNDTTLESQFVVEQVHTAFGADSSDSSHALSHDVNTPKEIRSIFDTITYNKGGSILRMIEKSYGTKIFYNSLTSYLKTRQFDSVTPQHLYAALQEYINEENQNITTFLNTWTTQPGYPVVHIKYVDDKTISLKQERFFFKKYERNSTNITWHIPITWATYNNRQEYFDTVPKFWLTEKETQTNSLEFSLFNVQQSGYYRVNYEEDYWVKLINLLRNPTFKLRQIHEINRAAIIDDVMNLARADYIDYKIAISATMYLKREIDYLPWRAFYNNLPYLNNRFRGRDIEGLYKKYLTWLIKPLYTRLGFMDNDDDHLTIMLRIHTRKWACKLDINDCKFKAKTLVQQKRQGKIIPPNYRDIVYCTAMRSDLTNSTYEFLWKEYLNSNFTSEKLVILSSLACSQKKDILKTLLKNTVTENHIRYQDSAKVFSNVYDESLIGVEVVMDVIKENYDDLLRLHFGDHTKIESIVSALASRLSTYDLYNQYKKLLDWLAEKIPTFQNSIDSYLSTAKYEFDWYEEKVPIIFEQLDQLFYDNIHRLPKTLQPKLYNVNLIPDMKTGTFNGTVQIHMEVKQDTTSIILNSHNLHIPEGSIKVYRNDPLEGEIKLLNRIENSQQLRIYLTKLVHVEEKIMVDIEFNGILNDNMQGFYRSFYVDSKGEQHWLATTQFEPTHARQAFPCFDEPEFKSRFTITIQRPKNYKTLSNMPCNISTEFENENYALDSCNTTKVDMSTYLVAFVVSKFESVDDSESSESEINVWGRPEVAKHGKFAQDIAKKLINELQEFTNINYSLPKLDLVGIPDFAMGAMENWGLATFREYGLFYDKNETTATYKKYIITVIAHELAHMWFGNLVTCDWWEYIWLNEGFAQYLEWYMASLISPDDKFMDQFVVYELQSALLNDASSSAHPMTNPVKTPKEISTIFDYVTYGKSASVLRMLFTELGEETYKSALRDYLNKTSYGTVRPTDLWDSFKQYVSISINKINVRLEEVMDTWTNQPGYPVVHAVLNNNRLTLYQERFAFLGDITTPEFYWIPIRVITSQNISNQINIQHKIWLGPNLETININPNSEWFIVNYEQTGFYRVNYDSESWLRLINELNSERFNIIPVSNRAQIIDDLFNLARANYVQYEILMRASQYLKRETHHLPWKAFFNGLSYVYERYKENDQNLIKKYVVNLLSNAYKDYSATIGFDSRDNDTLLDELNREMILQWACKFDEIKCIVQSKNLFRSWRNVNLKRIPRNARPAVYCTAIREGTTDDWEFLWKQYLSTHFGSEKKIIINALGCSKNETILYNYLKTAIKEYDSATAEIRKQDVSAVFASVCSESGLGVSVTLDFLISHNLTIYNYFGNWNDVGTLFQNVASHISDKNDYIKLLTFYTSNEIADKPELKEKLKSAITTIETNLMWYKYYSSIIVQWMQNSMLEDDNSSTRIESLNIVFVILIALISFFLNRR